MNTGVPIERLAVAGMVIALAMVLGLIANNTAEARALKELPAPGTQVLMVVNQNASLIAGGPLAEERERLTPVRGIFGPAGEPRINSLLAVQQSTGSISGTVLESEGGTPVVNADVYASEVHIIGYNSRTTTAAEGSYTIGGLGSGNYRVQVDATSQGFVPECYQNDLWCANPHPGARGLQQP